MLEPSLSSFLAFLKVGIIVAIRLATPPMRKCTVLAIRWVHMCQKLRQFLIVHCSDAVCVGFLFHPVLAKRRCAFSSDKISAICFCFFWCSSTTGVLNHFFAAIYKVITFFANYILCHNHSPFGGCQFDPVCRTKNKYITWLPYLSDAI